MKLLGALVSVFVFMGFILCPLIIAYEEVDPGKIVTSPEDYVNRNVTMTVTFGKISNRYEPWEEQANLKQDRTLKFFASPLSEIACYADKLPDNEKIIGNARPGQKLLISGYVKKCKREVKIKGERETFKRKVKGGERYVFIVKKIESVGEADEPARAPRLRRRRRGL